MKEQYSTATFRLSAGICAASLLLAGCHSSENQEHQKPIGPQGTILECTSAKLLDGVVQVDVNATNNPQKQVFIDTISILVIDKNGQSHPAKHAARSNSADFPELSRRFFSEATVSVTEDGYNGSVPCPTITTR